MPEEQREIVKSLEMEKISLPSWTPEYIKEWAERKAKENGMTLEEYINWFWQKTTPEEAEKYWEIAETFVWIIKLQEEVKEFMLAQEALIQEISTDRVASELTERAKQLISQAEKYAENREIENAETLIKEAHKLLDFSDELLNIQRKEMIKTQEQIENTFKELDSLTQKLLELTKGDDSILNDAKLYTLLEMTQEVSKWGGSKL